MNQISSRDIRKFVAGALTLAGFQALLFIPSYFTLSADPVHIVRLVMAGLISALSLPIGLGMFLGRWSAFFWAQVYLWLKFIIGCAAIPALWYFYHKTFGHAALALAPEILVAGALLGLIFWTTSERFRYEPDA